MRNPYEATMSSQADFVSYQASPFLIGARNGFLWSLILAVPASLVFYDESMMAMANRFDPVTLKHTQISLTASHRIVACIMACATATVYITLPWVVVAGCVKLARSKKTGHTIVEQTRANEALDQTF